MRVSTLPRIVPLGLLFAACSSSGSHDSGVPFGASGSAAGGASGTSSSVAGTGPTGAAGAQHDATGGSGVAAGSGNNAGEPSTGGASNAGTGGSAGAAAGGASRGGAAGAASGGSGGQTTTAWHAVPPATSWQWQLTGTLDTSLNVELYDIDLFDNDAAAVAALHQKGAQVICYVSVGSYEDWRPDAADFPQAVLGKDYPGWPGEKFLDIRALDALGPIMQKRLDSCKAKGFDGVEPDNMDVFEGGSSGTGFPLTESDGLAYASWLTTQAHARGLSIGQKNTSELASKLAKVMDWALTEDCFKDGWCADMQPFIAQGKAVLMSEYTDTGVNFGNACTWAKAHQFSAILKGRDLDAPVQFCP